MERFKKGTKVVCVDNGESANLLEIGNIYTVVKTYNGEIHLEECINFWYPHQFIPVSELEPFAVKFLNEYQMNELSAYSLAMGLKRRVVSCADSSYLFNLKEGIYGTTNYFKTLTFEQFKNNEHIMTNNRVSTTEKECVTPVSSTEIGCLYNLFNLRVSPEFIREIHGDAKRINHQDLVSKIEKEFPSLFPTTYQPGDRIKIANELYILAQVSVTDCNLISLKSGNRYGNAFIINDSNKYTEQEIKVNWVYKNIKLSKVEYEA